MNSHLWTWASPVWLAVALLLVAYIVFVRSRDWRTWAVLLAGLFVLAMAFVSPVGLLADGYLFSAHMVQHLLLLLIVPACLVLSLPSERAEQWFQRSGLNRIGKLLSKPVIGWTGGVGAMWFWHIPWLCSMATQHPAIGCVRDLSLVGAGLAFWWPIYSPCERYRLPALNGMLYLFSACLACTLLGIYITFAPLSVCPAFASTAGKLSILHALYDAGLTPGVDQHLGGLIMWVPPCLLYTCAIVSLLGRWYSEAQPGSTLITSSPQSKGAS